MLREMAIVFFSTIGIVTIGVVGMVAVAVLLDLRQRGKSRTSWLVIGGAGTTCPYCGSPAISSSLVGVAGIRAAIAGYTCGRQHGVDHKGRMVVDRECPIFEQCGSIVDSHRIAVERDLCPTCEVGITVPCLSPTDALAEATALVASFEGMVDNAENRAGLADARRIRALVYRQATDGRYRWPP